MRFGGSTPQRLYRRSGLGRPGPDLRQKLSSRYPAMEEMNDNFNLNLVWMDGREPADMARQLKWMEQNGEAVRANVPSPDTLFSQTAEERADSYWSVIRECL